jgi:hypothetical protein
MTRTPDPEEKERVGIAHPRPRFRLLLEAVPPRPDQPVINHTPRRLALVLKDLLRRHGFVCLAVEEVTPEPVKESPAP